ncbi:stress response protein NST1-like isoform X4, partial [Clarias magur]
DAKKYTISFNMKELVLSLLSRGYSHVVKTDGRRQYGRLEVCFEPEDYFIWKSQPPLLRLSRSGTLLCGVEPTPPKTYTTRRGPLILYSEDFASSSSQPDKVSRKERVLRASREEAEYEFYSLQDLTEAALTYCKKQAKVECHTSVTRPTLADPKPGTKYLQSHQRPGDECYYLTQTTGEETEKDRTFFRHQTNCVYPKPEQVRYQPRFLCMPRPNRRPPGPLPLITSNPAPKHGGDKPYMAAGEPATSKPTGAEERSITKGRRKRYIVSPRAQRNQMPESDALEETIELPEDHNDYMVAEHSTGYPKDLNSQWIQSAIETGGEEGGHAPRPAYMNVSLGCSHLSKVPGDRRQTEGGWHPSPEKQSDLHLPPIKQALHVDADSKDHGLKTGITTQENHKEPVPQLPDIYQPEVRTEAAAPKPPERTALKKVLVLLPFPLEQDGLSGLSEEKEEIEDVLCSDVEQKVESIRKEENRSTEHGFRLKVVQQDNLAGFEREDDKEHQTAVGLLPPFVGRRGLGKQCSMALYRQDPRDPADQPESQPGIIRGTLPLELRECQKDGVLGTLIMDPAGEIICLSFWDALTDTKDHPALNDATGEHVVRVMTSEGVLEESWTILEQLAEQATQTGALNDREVAAKRGHKKHTSSKQEDLSRLDDQITVEEMAECSGTEGTGGRRRIKRKAQACIPEQRKEKTNNCTESQPYNRGEDIVQQTGRRTQRPQPKARGRPGSPPRPGSASSTQETALSTPSAADEHIDKTKPRSHTESLKENVKSRKAGTLDNADVPHIRNVKRRVSDVNHAEDNVDTESQHTSFSEETVPGPIQKKNKKAGGEKAKSTKSQNTAEKIKKKTKDPAVFVVGKPRQSQEVLQTEKRKYGSRRRDTTISNTPADESEDKSEKDYSCDSSEYTVDDIESRQASTGAKTHQAGDSPGIDQDYIHNRKRAAGHSPETDPIAVSGDEGGAGDIDRISEFQEHNASAASFRSHRSAKSSCSSTWSIQRTSVSSDTGMFTPIQLPHRVPRLGAPTHHPASNPAKSDSAADAKGSEEAINLRESRVAAAQAAKAERRRLEVERKRKQKEEEKEQERKRQEDKELTEERLRLELEEEQRQRTQQARLRKRKEEEERQRQTEREMEGQRSEQAEKERERRKQEETMNKKRYLERLQKERHEEEMRRAAELKRQQEEEEARKEEEYRRLQEMDETERLEYLRRQREEEEERRKAAEGRRRAEEEAAMWDEEFN